MTDQVDDSPHGRLFWAGVVGGGGVVLVGLAGAWIDRADTHPLQLAIWLGGAGVVHDALLAPVFVVVALLTTRLPAWMRTPVRLGLAASALMTALAWPLVRQWGASPSNPSVLPLDYGRNLVAVLAAIWLAVAFVLVRRSPARQKAAR